MQKSRFALALRILLGIAVVGFLVRQGSHSGVHIRLDARAVVGGLTAVAMLAVAMFLSALRWKLVLGRQSPSTLTLWRYYLIGWFFSLFLPTSVGGDAVRAVAVGRSTASAGAALSSIVLERLLGVAALAFYLLLGCLAAPALIAGTLGGAQLNLSPAKLAAAGAAGVVVLAALGVVARRSRRLAAAVGDALRLWNQFRRSPLALSAALLVSLLVQAVYILVWYELALSFGLRVPFVAFLLFVPFVSLAAMVPVTLSGLGVREGAWALLLAPFGVAVGDAVGFSLAYYVSGLLLGLVGGLLFVLSGVGAKLKLDSDVSHDAHVPAATAAGAPGL